MDNPETMATPDTKDTWRRKTKQSNQTPLHQKKHHIKQTNKQKNKNKTQYR